MTNKGFYHNIHGDALHNLMIFEVKCYILKHGGVIKDTKVFKDRACKCEPDIFFEIETRGVRGNKRSKIEEIYVIEIETNATTESIKRKYEQYKESYAGLTDLLVFDMNKEYKKFAAEEGRGEVVDIYNNVALLRAFIDARLIL